MKIINKKCWQDMKKFCWTNFNKIRRFYLIKMKFTPKYW